MKYLIFILILFTGCDIFSTREPEAPEKPRLAFTNPVTPELLFENLINSFSNKSSENYNYCLLDKTYLNSNFRFIATSNAMIKYPKLSDWSSDDEKQSFFNFIKTNTNNSLALTLENPEWQNNINYRTYKYVYTIKVTNPQTKTTKVYSGTSQFDIYLDNRNFWVIVEWRDLLNDDNKCWSDLKGEYH